MKDNALNGTYRLDALLSVIAALIQPLHRLALEYSGRRVKTDPAISQIAEVLRLIPLEPQR